MPVIAKQGRLLAYQEHFQRHEPVARVHDRPGIASTAHQLRRVSKTSLTTPPMAVESRSPRTALATGKPGSPLPTVSLPVKVTSYAAAPAWHSRWSPNGRLLAFNHATEGNADIYTITPEGSSIRPLTSEPSSEETPSWSRDGRSIYFSSNRSGVFRDFLLPTFDQGQLAPQVRASRLYADVVADVSESWTRRFAKHRASTSMLSRASASVIVSGGAMRRHLAGQRTHEVHRAAVAVTSIGGEHAGVAQSRSPSCRPTHRSRRPRPCHPFRRVRGRRRAAPSARAALPR